MKKFEKQEENGNSENHYFPWSDRTLMSNNLSVAEFIVLV